MARHGLPDLEPPARSSAFTCAYDHERFGRSKLRPEEARDPQEHEKTRHWRECEFIRRPSGKGRKSEVLIRLSPRERLIRNLDDGPWIQELLCTLESPKSSQPLEWRAPSNDMIPSDRYVL